MSQKWDNVRLVTFQEDYKSKSGQILYRKGRTVAMHVRNIEKMKARGAKADVKPVNREKLIENAKKELARREKEAKERMYVN